MIITYLSSSYDEIWHCQSYNPKNKEAIDTYRKYTQGSNSKLLEFLTKISEYIETNKEKNYKNIKYNLLFIYNHEAIASLINMLNNSIKYSDITEKEDILKEFNYHKEKLNNLNNSSLNENNNDINGAINFWITIKNRMQNIQQYIFSNKTISSKNPDEYYLSQKEITQCCYLVLLFSRFKLPISDSDIKINDPKIIEEYNKYTQGDNNLLFEFLNSIKEYCRISNNNIKNIISLQGEPYNNALENMKTIYNNKNLESLFQMIDDNMNTSDTDAKFMKKFNTYKEKLQKNDSTILKSSIEFFTIVLKSLIENKYIYTSIFRPIYEKIKELNLTLHEKKQLDCLKNTIDSFELPSDSLTSKGAPIKTYNGNMGKIAIYYGGGLTLYGIFANDNNTKNNDKNDNNNQSNNTNIKSNN